MTSSSHSAYNASSDRKRGSCCGWGAHASWSGSNILALVLGFVFFWPLGLFFLYWILKGRQVNELPGKISEKWSQFKGGNMSRSDTSDNIVFNEYQQTQYDRIREIRDEIKDRAQRFSQFRSDAKRRADEEEFRRFMDEAPSR